MDRLRGDLPRSLSPRQTEALQAVYRTGSRADAARALGVTRHTLAQHLKEALARLRVDNTWEAAYVLWLRHAWDTDASIEPGGLL